MYLDPGFGGMLMQAIIALVAVGGATLYAVRRKIKGFFTSAKKKEPKRNIDARKHDGNMEEAIDALADNKEGDAIDSLAQDNKDNEVDSLKKESVEDMA